MTDRPPLPERPESGLDPEDWEALRALGHRMVDDVIAYHRDVRKRPAWQPVPPAEREAFSGPLPEDGAGADAAYAEAVEHILPYPYGNIHPRHWGWVNGAGTTLGAFAEMMAAAMNPNCWGGEHAASYVEAQVVDWLKALVGFSPEASGVLLSGGSEANLVGLAAARDERARGDVAVEGLRGLDADPVVYCSTETHNSVDKAISLLGLGAVGLQRIPVDDAWRIDVEALRSAIDDDLSEGRQPIAVVGNAGTVNTGAIDDLDGLADLCADYDLWLHVDGAFGALAALSPALRPLVKGMQRADSLAFDLHKWLQIPIEAACVLVRDPADHRRPFSPPASYLATFRRGIASGEHFFAPLGPQLTRGFRALKVWLALRAHGAGAYRRLVEQNVRQARRLEALVRARDELELLAGASLNVVCFRYAPAGMPEADADRINRELLQRVQESGVAAPSSTVVRTRFVLRCAFTNHRTRLEDLDLFVDTVVRLGGEISESQGG
ncbi:MAG: aminotransferase class I/II-fold pyridoxal phosphate-dependent enzyme [Gemmatimonadota bacterium]